MERAQVMAAITAVEAEIVELGERREAACRRLHILREQLSAERQAPAGGWSVDGKIELFRSLFAGRTDVYAARWENRRGGVGYSPRCANEWRAGICAKPRVRCADCSSQAFAPLDAGVVRDHLQGRAVVGVYPLLADDRCRLVAIDLDGPSWPADVRALREVAAELGVWPAVERSRSGAGAHLWWFFAEAVPAARARALGSLMLTRAMARSPTLRMASYDRLFPSQDRMPAGGFGNLIALPLQRAARDHGNTVFLDDELEPYPDQWGFLAAIRRVSSERLGELVGGRGSDAVLGVGEPSEDARTPWRPARPVADRLAGTPLPAVVRATVARRVYVERAELPPALLDAVRRLAVFANPQFGERQALRLSTARTPRMIACFEDLPHHVGLPRGCAEGLHALLAELGVRLELRDERSAGSPIEAAFTAILRPDQRRAVRDVLAHDVGVLCAPPGTGKTVMAAAMIAERARSTLVLVHRRALVEQWRDRLLEVLDLDADAIGVLGSGGAGATATVDIATVQTLARGEPDGALLGRYGHVVVDECHHVPAVSIERVLAACPARHVTGLTATPYRRDGHQPIIAMQCGPVRHTIRERTAAAPTVQVIRRDTSFDAAGLPPEASIQEIYGALAGDQQRLDLVTADIRALLAEGRVALVLTERRDHLDRFAEALRADVDELVLLHGGVTPRRRRQALERLRELPPDAGRVVLATGRYIGEGFDDPRLDTLLLTMPIAWKGTVVQYAGRLHRPHPGKTDVRIYDYVDAAVPVLRRMFAKRVSAYRAMRAAIHDDPAAFARAPRQLLRPASAARVAVLSDP